MGCIFSGSRSRASLYQVETGPPEQTDPPKVFSWDKSDRPDAKDFVFKDLKSECKVKAPGSIQGQQFIIENCQDCNIYLFDNSAAVNIDECKDCRILVGPVDGSLFVRDCKNCTIVSVCRQFRTRDCYDCTCMLSCCTKPIIESSSRSQFGCIDTGYKGLTAQMESVRLSKFQNFWSDVYDFTPGTHNWDFLPLECPGIDLLKPIPSQAYEYLTGEAEEAIPKTHGARQVQTDASSFCWVVFSGTAPEAAWQFLRTVHCQLQDVVLMRTTEAKLEQQAISCLKTHAEQHETITLLQSEAHIGLEFQGASCNAVESLAKQAGACLVSRHPEDALLLRFAGLG